MKKRIGKKVVAYGMCAALMSGFLGSGIGGGSIQVQAAEIASPNETAQVGEPIPTPPAETGNLIGDETV